MQQLEAPHPALLRRRRRGRRLPGRPPARPGWASPGSAGSWAVLTTPWSACWPSPAPATPSAASSASAARLCPGSSSSQTLDGFAFDVEVLYLARRLGLTVRDFPRGLELPGAQQGPRAHRPSVYDLGPPAPPLAPPGGVSVGGAPPPVHPSISLRTNGLPGPHERAPAPPRRASPFSPGGEKVRMRGTMLPPTPPFILPISPFDFPQGRLRTNGTARPGSP